MRHNVSFCFRYARSRPGSLPRFGVYLMSTAFGSWRNMWLTSLINVADETWDNVDSSQDTKLRTNDNTTTSISRTTVIRKVCHIVPILFLFTSASSRMLSSSVHLIPAPSKMPHPLDNFFACPPCPKDSPIPCLTKMCTSV